MKSFTGSKGQVHIGKEPLRVGESVGNLKSWDDQQYLLWKDED